MTKKDAVKLVKSFGYWFDDTSCSDDLWFRGTDSTRFSFVRVRNVRRSQVLVRQFDDSGVELDDGSWMIEVNCHYIYHLNDVERTVL